MYDTVKASMIEVENDCVEKIIMMSWEVANYNKIHFPTYTGKFQMSLCSFLWLNIC